MNTPEGEDQAYWQGMLLGLEKEKKGTASTKLTIASFLLLNLAALLLTDEYAVLWILSSLLFCVFSILFIIMPTTKRSLVQGPKEAPIRLDPANVLDKKELLGLAFWNGFFINSQPMALGIITIFSLDISSIVYLGLFVQVLTLDVTVLLLLQSVGMILYYVGIVRIRPYDLNFLEKVRSIGRSVEDVLHGRSVRHFRSAFLTILVLSIFVASLIAAMLLPGSSIRMLRGNSNVDLAKEIVPLVLIFLSQFLLVRKAQGLSSRIMAEDLLRRKLKLLSSRDDPEQPGLEGLEERMPAYFKVVRHDIIGFLPVYLMNPDLGAILGDRSTSLNHPYGPG
jgi:hypothetical protein